jgi:ATP-dependent Clp protease ATP-binding subunit ClpA
VQVQKQLKAELVNRLGAVIVFEPLSLVKEIMAIQMKIVVVRVAAKRIMHLWIEIYLAQLKFVVCIGSTSVGN